MKDLGLQQCRNIFKNASEKKFKFLRYITACRNVESKTAGDQVDHLLREHETEDQVTVQSRNRNSPVSSISLLNQ